MHTCELPPLPCLLTNQTRLKHAHEEQETIKKERSSKKETADCQKKPNR